MTKTMTIHEFLEMVRVKEFNQKRSKKNKQILVLLALLIILGIATGQIDSNETITAFQINNISLF